MGCGPEEAPMPVVGLWELCCRWPAPVLPALVPYIPPCVEDLRRGVVDQLLGDPVSGLGVHGKKLGWRAQLSLLGSSGAAYIPQNIHYRNQGQKFTSSVPK